MPEIIAPGKTAVDANIEKIKLSKYKRGMLLAFTVIIAVFAVSALILATAYSINLYAGVIAEAVMTWQILPQSVFVWRA